MAKGGRVVVKKSRRGISSWKGDEEEEEDDDEYIAEEEEDLESESYYESLASSSDSGDDGGGFGGNFGEFSGSDGSFEEESDFEFDDSEFEEEEEEIRAKSLKKGTQKSGKNQTKSRRKVSDSDEDDEDFDVEPVLNQNRRKQARKSESEKSDYEVEEEEDYSDDMDEDFTPEVDEEDEECIWISKRKNGYKKEKASKSPVKRTRKNKTSKVSRRKKPTVTKTKKEKRTKKKRRRGRKKSSSKEPAAKRRRRTTQIKDDDFIVDDDDFTVEDWVEAKKKTNKSLKRKPLSDTETSEFEFITSDEDEFVIQEQIGPKKRKKYNVCISGSDSSDSDYVIYEEEEVVKEGRKRKRESEKGKEKEREKEEDLGKKMCGICLSEEQKRTTRGVLDCCAHFFCFACIVEWSKVESRCPVCKRRFETITKASSSDSDDLGFGAPRKVIKVPKRDQVYQPSEEDIRGMLDPYENVVCMECQQGGADNLMLLCDICDSSAHTYCVGLGNSVPEGNWYCDCCRSAGVGPSNPQPQPQPSVSPAGPAPPEFDPSVNLQPTTSSVPALEIDLNAPPRDILEEAAAQVLGAPPQVSSPSAGGAATLSGRRAIQNRIRILLSSTRPMQVLRRNGGEGGSVSNGVGFGMRVGRHLSQQGSVLAPNRERGGSHNAEEAKEQVRSMVKTHLRELCSNLPLDRDAFKDVARRATYTVLAACGFGIEHRNLICTSISARTCTHETRDSEQASLLAGSCSACFESFVKDVVVSILNRG